MRKLLIALAVLVVLVVVVDRIAVAVAENKIAGRIATAYGLPAGGLSSHAVHVPILATVVLGVSGDGISVTPVSVGIQRRIPVPLSGFTHRLRFVVPLGALPLHLHLTSVHVTPGGLRIGAIARDVQFARA